MFKKIKKWKIFVAICLLVLGVISNPWTMVHSSPMTSLSSEVSGVSVSNSSQGIRDWIMPIFFLAIIFMALQEGIRIRREERSNQ